MTECNKSIKKQFLKRILLYKSWRKKIIWISQFETTTNWIQIKFQQKFNNLKLYMNKK